MEYDLVLKENSGLKRDLAVANARLEAVKGENEALVYEIEGLTSEKRRSEQVNEHLKAQVHLLQLEKKELTLGYQHNINEIKKEIESKQSELDQFQNRITPSFDSAILKMKITHELEGEYLPKLQLHQQEILELKGKYNDSVREIELLQEKLRLREKYINNTVEEMRENHLLEINNLTKTIANHNQSSRVDEMSLKQINRKLKRQVAELRERILYKDRELEDIHQEKMNLKERMNEITISLNESAFRSKEESKIVRNQYEMMAKAVSEYEGRKEQEKIVGSEKDRVIKRLKDEKEEAEERVEGLERKVRKLEEKIEDGQIEMSQLRGKLNNEGDRLNYELIKNSLGVLEKEHDTLRGRFEEVKKQNRELLEEGVNQRKQIGSLSEKAKRKGEGQEAKIKDFEQNIDEALSKQSTGYQKIIKVLKKQIDNANELKNKAEEKSEKNKRLLKEANSKILQLIQRKIVSHKDDSPQPRSPPPVPLSSPTPTLKKVFEFRSEGKYIIPESHIPTSLPASPLVSVGKFNPQYRFQSDLQRDFYASNKSLHRSRSPISPTFRGQQLQTRTISAAGGKSSFEFYELAKKMEPRKVSPACGHKHH